MGAQPPTAEEFDAWYAGMVGSPARDEIGRRHLGLPVHVVSTSLLTWDGIADVVAGLGAGPGCDLLDLACGRGGYGLEVAARTGAALVGVDFSAEALRQARDLAAGLGHRARFVVGELTATGLPDGAVDAVMCVDAVQFAVPPSAVYAELARVLRPGGRVVLTCWEPVDPGDPRLPERLRAVDLAAGLAGAGFVAVEVTERSDWYAVELALWREAAALDPGDDVALRSLHEEGERVLARADASRRVIATATRP